MTPQVALLAGALLICAVTALAVSWTTETWDFSIPGGDLPSDHYTFDNTAIEVNPAAQPGVARLQKPTFSETVDTDAGFHAAGRDTLVWNPAGYLELGPGSYSWTHTTDADFNDPDASFTDTVVSGTGDAAVLQLAPAMDVGDGSNGAYTCSSSCTLSAGTYNFTSFNITAGFAVTVPPSSVPLILKVQGPTAIDGTLRLNGENADATSAGSGGAGGFDGGYSSSHGEAPADVGGIGGRYGCSLYDGGGGGGFAGEGGDAGSAGGSCGQGGPSYLIFNSSGTIHGGSGGGRGHIGGGGGGGGGAIQITSGSNLTIGTSGRIEVHGGNGGTRFNMNGGGGGGGAGGAVFLESALLLVHSGLIWAEGGDGRSHSGTGTGIGGGGGSGGRVSLHDADGNIAGTGTTNVNGGVHGWPSGSPPAQDGPDGSLLEAGPTVFPTGSYTSAVWDAGSSMDVTTVAWTPAIPPIGTTLDVFLQAGNTPTPDGSWIGPILVTNGVDTLGTFDGYRYLQYQVSFATASPILTPTLDSITVNYFSGVASQGMYTSQVLDSMDLGTGLPANIWRTLNWDEGPIPRLGEGVDPSTPGLVSLWSFEEGEGTIAANSVDGGPDVQLGFPPFVTPGWTRDGRVGMALALRGNNDGAATTTPLMVPTNWAMEAWVFDDGTTTVSEALLILNGTGSNGYSLRRGPGGELRVRIGTDPTVSTGVFLEPNVWTHLVLTHEGATSSATLWKNAVVAWTDTVTTPLPPNPGDALGIGLWFGGRIDEVAVYDTFMTPQMMAEHYLQGVFDITFEMRVALACPDPGDAATCLWYPWHSLTTVPDFTAPIATNRHNLLGLWHLDEGAGPTVSDTTLIVGGYNRVPNDGAITGATWTTDTPSGVGAALEFSNAVGVVIPADPELMLTADELSVETWVKVVDGLQTWYYMVLPGAGNALLLIWEQPLFIVGSDTGNISVQDNLPLQVGQWYHLLGTYDGQTARLYVDGVLRASQPGVVSVDTGGANLQFGLVGNFILDEIAIYDRALERPHSGSPVDLTGKVTSERYAQFRTTLRSDHSTLSPRLSAVTLDAWRYVETSPSLVNVNSLPASTLLNSFTETTTPQSQGTITYQLSNVGPGAGDPWYYHDGVSWLLVTDAANPAQRSDVSQLTTHLADFPQEVGLGPLHWKAFLNSDGTQPVELDQLDIEYDNSSFGILVPAAGAVWRADTVQRIDWSKGGLPHGIQTVKLEYSPDGGSTYQMLEAAAANGSNPGCTSLPNAGCYVWTPAVADASDGVTTSIIRIGGADAGSEAITALSPAFTVAQLDLTSPLGGEVWEYGSTQVISWLASAAVSTVDLNYAPDGDFGSPITLASALPAIGATPPGSCVPPAAGGCFAWAIDDTAYLSTPTVDVSLMEVATTIGLETINDVSGTFTVGQLDLEQPVGGELWRIGTGSHTIAWQDAPPNADLILTYTPNGVAIYPIATILAASNTGTYDWDIPADPTFISAPDAGHVRIETTFDGILFQDESPGMTVAKPLFTIQSPSDGEVVPISPPVYTVQWSSEGLPISDNLKLSYRQDGGALTQIANGLTNGQNGSCTPPPGQGCYNWIVPAAAASNNLELKLEDNVNPFADGLSGTFAIAGSFAIISPSSAVAKWAVGKSHTIQWTNTGEIQNVRIEFSEDGPGGPFAVLSDVVTDPPFFNNGSFDWIPTAGDATTDGVIRLFDPTNPSVQPVLSTVFAVTDVAVQAPVGGERWQVGSSQTISWTHTGLSTVQLFFSTDPGGGVMYTEIDPGFSKPAGPGGAGSYDWTIPDAVKKDTVTIHVVDGDESAGETQAEAFSNPFTIFGTLRILVPNGGESWSTGTPNAITWTTDTGTIPTVTLEYSLDDFLNATTIVASTANDGSYDWTPSFTSALVKVRVSDIQDPPDQSIPQAERSWDESDDIFTIAGLSVTAPNSSSTWLVGTAQSILWGTVPPVPSTAVTLDYSTDDFACDLPQNCGLIAENQVNAGANSIYNWASVADAIGTAVKIRVDVTNVPGLIGISGPFTVTGQLTMATPNGGETFEVGSDQTISWTKIGTIDVVSLDYSADGGSTWFPVEDGAGLPATNLVNPDPAGGSFTWRIPDAISSQVRVRILDAVAGHPVTADGSDASFTIRAAFGFVEPTAASVWAVNQSPTTTPAIAPITWTTSGTVSQVLLEYSTDGFATSTPIGTVPNTGSYDWTVADVVPDPQNNPEISTVQVRVSDADAGHPIAELISESFTVKWFTINWEIRDSENSGLLSQLSVNDVSPVANWPGWQVTDFSLLAPVVHTYPFGSFTTTWSKDGYFSSTVSGWAADADKTVTVFLESEQAQLIPYHVTLEWAYDPATDTMNFTTWLEKSGQLLFPEDPAQLIRFGPSHVKIFEGTNLLIDLMDPVPELSGHYEITWNPTGLVPGTIYFVQASVVYDSTERTSGGGVNIAIQAASGGVTLTELQQELTPIETAVTTDLPAQITAVQTTADTIVTGVAGIQATTDQLTTDVAGVQATADQLVTDVAGVQATADAIQTDTQTILFDPATGLPNIQDLINQHSTTMQNKVNALRRGGILGGNQELELGEDTIIQYLPVDPALVPTLNLYDALGAPVPGPLMLLNPTTGLYEAAVSLVSLGEYRAVVTEAASAESAGTLDSITLRVREPSATAQAVTGVADQLTAMGAQVDVIDTNLNNLAVVATDIQLTANDTNTLAQGISADTQGLLAKWGTLSAQDLDTALTDLSVQLGTPAQAADLQTALTQLTQLQTDLTNVANTMAQDADMQNALTVLSDIQTNMATDANLQTALTQLTQLQIDLTNLSTQMGTPAQDADLQAALTELATIQTSLGNLSTQLGTPAQDADLQTALTELAAVQTTLTNLVTQVGTPAQAAELQTALTQLTQLQTDLTDLSTQVGTPAQQAALDGAVTQLTQLQTDLTQVATDMARDADVQTALGELSTLQTAVAAVQTTLGTPAQAAAVTQLQTQLTGVDTVLTTLAGTQGATMDSVMTEFGNLETLITALPAVEAVDQSERLDAIAATLGTMGQDLLALGTPAQGTTVDDALVDVLAQVSAVQQTVTALQGEQTDSGSLLAKLDDLEQQLQSAEGSAAAVGFSQSAFAAASQAVELIQQLQTQLASQSAEPAGVAPLLVQLQGSLGDVQDHVNHAVSVVPAGLDVEAMHAQLTEVTEQIKSLASEQGLGSLYEIAEHQAGDVKSVRNRVNELKALLDLQNKMLRDNFEQATFSSWLETGSVILKILAVNPSESETKAVQIKSYLPKEARPEHVLDTDGLELEYDAQMGAYFVYGTLSLGPKESAVRSIHIDDIWVVPSERLAALQQETVDSLANLRGTGFEERGEVVSQAIMRRLAEVEVTQDELFPVSPELHISRYRENLKTLQLVEADLVSLRQLMVMAVLGPSTGDSRLGGLGEAEQAGTASGGLSVFATWQMIAGILVLLGTVSLSFFLVWQRQLKVQLAKQNSLSEPILRGTSPLAATATSPTGNGHGKPQNGHARLPNGQPTPRSTVASRWRVKRPTAP